MPLGRICPRTQAICTTCTRTCRRRERTVKKLTARRIRNMKVWGSKAHRRQRLRILARDGWACVRCGHHAPTGHGLVADHIHGIDAVRVFDDSELQTLCLRCSGRKDG